jgi:hypothetical protein
MKILKNSWSWNFWVFFQAKLVTMVPAHKSIYKMNIYGDQGNCYTVRSKYTILVVCIFIDWYTLYLNKALDLQHHRDS